MLASQDRLPKIIAEKGVRCVLKKMTAAEARKRSIRMNALRENTHPADEFDAYAQMEQDGASAADIAKEFNVSELFVKQRMKLGRLHPEILQAFRDDRLSVDVCIAYAFCEDQARQIAVFNELGPDAPQHRIRDHIRPGDDAKATDGVAVYVGADRYEDQPRLAALAWALVSWLRAS